MKVTLVPSTVVGGGPEHYQYTSSTVLNDTIAIDAGCLGFYQSPEVQAKIRHVLLTHSHIDHVGSLPIFVENAYEGKRDCVTVHASAVVLDCCQRDLFNDRLWPDFFTLSKNREAPFVKALPFEAGQTRELEGLKFTAVALNHSVPTNGFVVEDAHSAVAFVYDTGPSEEIWRVAAATPNLKAMFIEVTFPNEMVGLAELSRHLTPALLAAELNKLGRPVRVIVVHIKARYQTRVIAELEALNLPGLEIGQFAVPYHF